MYTSGPTGRVFLIASGVESGVPCASPYNESVSLYKSSVSTCAFVFYDFGTGSLIEGGFRLGAFSVSEYCEGSSPRPKITKEVFFLKCFFFSLYLCGFTVEFS